MPYEGQIKGTATPAIQNISWNRENPLPPSITDILVKRTQGVVEFVEWYIQFENTSVEWMDSAGSTSGLMDFDGISESLPLQFKNLDQLPGSNYKATIHFTFSNTEDSYFQTSAVINLSISGEAADAIRTDKSNYNVIYRRSTDTLSGETHIDILNNTDNYNFTLETVGTLFQELSSDTGFDLEEDPAFPFATNPELPSTGSNVVSCRLKKDGQYYYSFTVTIIVIDLEDIVAEPSELSFLIRNGFNETESDILKIINPLNKDFTIEAPEWLNLSINSGSSSSDVIVTTVNSDGITAGNYSGNIEISYDANVISVPVYLTVSAFVTIAQSDYNFCLDGVILQATKMLDAGVFVRINLKMQFTTDEGTKEFESIYSTAYFNGSVSTDLGEKVQNYFPFFEKHLFDNSSGFNNRLVYRPANIQITVEELDVNYNVIHSLELAPIKLFPGKRPAKFPLLSNYGFRRRYAEFYHIFSYYTGLINPDQITNAGVPVNPAGDNDVQTAFVTNESVLNFDLIKNNLGLEFIPYPKVEKQVILQWLNNNLVPECMIFSGSYVIEDDFEHSVDSYQINGKKYESKEVGKITIKTGFILKDEILLLKEIALSKISYMKIGDKIYDCVCTTPKLIREDSEENLISREMTFFIVL